MNVDVRKCERYKGYYSEIRNAQIDKFEIKNIIPHNRIDW